MEVIFYESTNKQCLDSGRHCLDFVPCRRVIIARNTAQQEGTREFTSVYFSLLQLRSTSRLKTDRKRKELLRKKEILVFSC